MNGYVEDIPLKPIERRPLQVGSGGLVDVPAGILNAGAVQPAFDFLLLAVDVLACRADPNVNANYDRSLTICELHSDDRHDIRAVRICQ